MRLFPRGQGPARARRKATKVSGADQVPPDRRTGLLRGPSRARPSLGEEQKPFSRGELDQLRTYLIHKAGREWARLYRRRKGGAVPLWHRPRERDLLLVDLIAHTGLRASEAARLTSADLHLAGDRPFLLVRGGKKRAPRQVDSLPLAHDLAQRLREWIEGTNLEQELFVRGSGVALGRRGVWECVKHGIRKAGLRDTLHVHSLRHTFLTALAAQPDANPLAVMKLGRVRDLQTVMGYFHLARDTRQAMVEGLGLARSGGSARPSRRSGRPEEPASPRTRAMPQALRARTPSIGRVARR